MSDAAAARLAEFLHAHKDALYHAILEALHPLRGERSWPLLREWIDGQIDFFHGRPDRTAEWAAMLREGVRAAGGGPVETLGTIRVFRETLLGFCRGKVADLDDWNLGRLILDMEDRHVRHIADHYVQAERENLSAERRRLRALAETMASPFVTMDTSGIIGLANSAFGKEIGIAPDALAGRALSSLCDDATAVEIGRTLRQRKSTVPRVFLGNLINARGAPVPVRFSIQSMFDAQGRRDSLAVAMDRREARETSGSGRFIYEVAEKVAVLLRVAIQVIHRDGQVLYQNDVAIGPSAQGALCCRLHALSGGEGPCGCRRAFETGETSSLEITAAVDGRPAWYERVLVPLRNRAGEITRVVCAARDVSAARQLEHQMLRQQQTSLVSQVAVAVAHQLRNPLGVMIGFAEMLSKGLPGDQAAHAIESLLRNGLRCKEIVEGLLEFGQGFPGERAPADVNGLLRERVRTMIPSPGNERIAWRFAETPCRVLCVPEQLAQVLLNLLDNALQSGAAHVTVSVEAARNMVALRIADDGPGIPAELRERVFEPFFTTRRDAGAVGLGLSLSRAVAGEYGGRLRIDPEHAPGACFVLELPLLAAQEAPAAPAGVRRRILLVDDEADLLEMLATALEIRGFSVDTAVNADEAVAHLKGTPYDGVVFDIQLPGEKSGADLYEYVIDAHRPLAERTLFITADTMNYETRRALERIQRPVLEKPFLISDFIRQIDALFASNA